MQSTAFVVGTRAELQCPNPYPGIESLTGPKEVWWLNALDSEAHKQQVYDAYVGNRPLMAALEDVTKRKARLVGTQVAGLIGPPGRQWRFTGTLDGAPILLGCSDKDPHIPRDRLEESARELSRMGGDVELKIYPGPGHAMNQDELDGVQQMLDGAITSQATGPSSKARPP